MKTLLSTIAFCLFFNCSLFGQFILNSSSVVISGDSAIVRLVVSFGFGNMGDCAPLTGYQISTENDSIDLQLFYNLGVAGPTVQCAQVDTVYLTGLNLGHSYYLQVFANSFIGADTVYNLNGKTFNFSLVSSQPKPLTQNISLYPNPTTEAVTINFNDATAEYRTIEISDVYGRRIWEEVVNSAQTEISIPVTDLPAGLYFCAVREGNKMKQLKFVKQ